MCGRNLKNHYLSLLDLKIIRWVFKIWKSVRKWGSWIFQGVLWAFLVNCSPKLSFIFNRSQEIMRQHGAPIIFYSTFSCHNLITFECPKRNITEHSSLERNDQSLFRSQQSVQITVDFQILSLNRQLVTVSFFNNFLSNKG